MPLAAFIAVALKRKKNRFSRQPIVKMKHEKSKPEHRFFVDGLPWPGYLTGKMFSPKLD